MIANEKIKAIFLKRFNVNEALNLNPQISDIKITTSSKVGRYKVTIIVSNLWICTLETFAERLSTILTLCSDRILTASPKKAPDKIICLDKFQLLFNGLAFLLLQK